MHDYTVTDWSTEASAVPVTEWSQQPGPQVPLPHDPLGLFCFFDNDLVSLVVYETNQVCQAVTPRHRQGMAYKC